jgi:hypothetical protein
MVRSLLLRRPETVASRKHKPNHLQLEMFAPAPVTAITARRAARGRSPYDHRVPYGVALREITARVKAANPELGGAARGELVRGVMDLAMKAGRVRFDFEGAA